MKKIVYVEDITCRMIEHSQKEQLVSTRFHDYFCFKGVSRNRKETIYDFSVETAKEQSVKIT